MKRRDFLGLSLAASVGAIAGRIGCKEGECPSEICNPSQTSNSEPTKEVYMEQPTQSVEMVDLEKVMGAKEILELMGKEEDPLLGDIENFDGKKVAVRPYDKSILNDDKSTKEILFKDPTVARYGVDEDGMHVALPGGIKADFRRIMKAQRLSEDEDMFWDRKDNVVSNSSKKAYFKSFLEQEDIVLPIIHQTIEHIAKETGIKIPLKVVIGILLKEYPSSLRHITFSDGGVSDPKKIFDELKKGTKNEGVKFDGVLLKKPAGPFQLNKETAESFGLEVSMENDERYNFPKALNAALIKLLEGYQHFGQQWGLAMVNYCGTFGSMIWRIEQSFGKDVFEKRADGKYLKKEVADEKGINLVTYHSKNFAHWGFKGSAQYPFRAMYLLELLQSDVTKKFRQELKKK